MSSSDPPTRISNEHQRFLSAVLKNPVIVTILERMPQLELEDWYLTAGGLFQTIWNVLTLRWGCIPADAQATLGPVAHVRA